LLPVAFGHSEHATYINFIDSKNGWLVTVGQGSRVRLYSTADGGILDAHYSIKRTFLFKSRPQRAAFCLRGKNLMKRLLQSACSGFGFFGMFVGF